MPTGKRGMRDMAAEQRCCEDVDVDPFDNGTEADEWRYAEMLHKLGRRERKEKVPEE
jgi:hypothetical protein